MGSSNILWARAGVSTHSPSSLTLHRLGKQYSLHRDPNSAIRTLRKPSKAGLQRKQFQPGPFVAHIYFAFCQGMFGLKNCLPTNLGFRKPTGSEETFSRASQKATDLEIAKLRSVFVTRCCDRFLGI